MANISVFETVIVSERSESVQPGLSQGGLGLVAGNTYRLTFDATITTGVIEVYQGGTLIYRTDTIPNNTSFEDVFVTERMYLDHRTSFSVNNTVTVSENVVIFIFYPEQINDSVTVSENIVLGIS